MPRCVLAVAFCVSALASSTPASLPRPGTYLCGGDPAEGKVVKGSKQGPFWLNRGSGLPKYSTTATLSINNASNAYVITFDASDSQMSHFSFGKAVTSTCSPRAISRETFGVLLARGPNTPTKFAKVTVELGDPSVTDHRQSSIAASTAQLRYTADVSHADAWCDHISEVSAHANLKASVSPMSSACAASASAAKTSRRVQIVVPMSEVPEGAPGPAKADGYVRAQFFHTYYDSSDDAYNLPTYTSAFPTFANDNAQPGCYARPKNFQLFCTSTANQDPAITAVCKPPPYTSTFVKDFAVENRCPVGTPSNTTSTANTFVPQHILPLPKTWTSGDSSMPIPKEFATLSHMTTQCGAGACPAKVQSLIESAIIRFRASARLDDATSAATVPQLIVTIDNFDSKSLQMNLKTNESYQLNIDSATVTIDSSTVWGTLHALTTLLQLTETKPTSSTGVVDVTVQSAPWTVTDAPRYGHRGVLVDTSRQYLSVPTLQSIIDSLSLAKMNVLHWHITDATSFPIQLTTGNAAKLSQYGKYSDSSIYTQANVKSLVQYGYQRGVRILPEIDTPGHSYSWGKAQKAEPSNTGLKGLMECDNMTSQFWPMCPEPPCGYLNVTNVNAQNLAKDVWTDVANLFNTSDYVHVGGDEQSHTCWQGDTEKKFHKWFEVLLGHLNQKSLGTINWAGSVISLNTNLTNLTRADVLHETPPMLQAWSEDANKMKALKLGYGLIDSSASHWYLDCGVGNWLGSNVGGMWPGKSWCTPFKTWQTVYAYDPEDGVTENYWGMIKGGEVALWGEQNGETNYESKLWPRAAAAAERLWSDKSARDPACAQERIRAWRERLVLPLPQGLGQRPTPMQAEYCRHDPSMCNAYLFVSGLFVPTCDASTTKSSSKLALILGLCLGLGLGGILLVASLYWYRKKNTQSHDTLLPGTRRSQDSETEMPAVRNPATSTDETKQEIREKATASVGSTVEMGADIAGQNPGAP
eukprot:g1421.t1